ADLARVLSGAQEFAELPVRHNEDRLNADLAQAVPWEADAYALDSPHTKTFLLLQAHFVGAELPIADYVNDTKSVLDQALRVLNGLVDIAADEGLLAAAVGLMRLSQMVGRGGWTPTTTLGQLPTRPRAPGRCVSRWRGGEEAARAGRRGFAPEAPARVAADGDCELVVSLRLVSGDLRKAHAPKFHKPKGHGWWLALGSAEGELLALKRVTALGGGPQRLAFLAPEEPGRHALTLRLVADAVMGMDREVRVYLDVV
ncbi:unnamed protein product, partial [Heterosigma akashiwo]